MKKNLVAVLVAALGITAGAAAFAQAQPDDPTTSTAPTEERRKERSQEERARPEGRKPRGEPGGPHALGRAVHGDLIVRDGEGGFEEVTFDRGTLEAVSGDSITIARPDGPKVTVTVNGDTKYRGVESKDALRTGERVLVVSKDGVATQVAQRPPRGDQER